MKSLTNWAHKGSMIGRFVTRSNGPKSWSPILTVKSSHLKSANGWTWGTYLDLENHWLQNHWLQNQTSYAASFLYLWFFWELDGCTSEHQGMCGWPWCCLETNMGLCLSKAKPLFPAIWQIFCLKWKIAHHAQTDWNHLTWTWTWHIFLKDLRTYTYPLIRPLYKAFYLGEADKGGILEVDIDSNVICLALVSGKDKDPPSPCQRSFRELDAYVQVRPLNDLLNCSFVLL